MPHIRGKLENGRIRIKVGIRPYQPYGPVDGLSATFSLNYRECMALIDTGARRTCVSEKIVQDIGLKRIGRADVWNVKRSEAHWTYLFHVGVWPDTEDGSPTSIYGIGEEIEGIDVGNHPYFDVLIGMDIISQCRLLIEPNGTFELSF